MKQFQRYLMILSFSFLLSASCTARVLRVELKELTALDDEDQHLTVFKLQPGAELILPDFDAGQAMFFDVFYTRDMESDPNINVMLIPGQEADLLFIDVNNDENLTNDGPPLVFPQKDNSIYFDIVSNTDSQQKTKIVLSRQPVAADSIRQKLVDDDGNLSSGWAKFYGAAIGDFEFKGQRGSFYFDDRVTVRRGELHLGNKTVLLGLFDYSNNGLYNDKDDVLLIDLDGNGKLKYFDAHEVFKLNDVFSIDSQNYKISNLDKYGEWLEVVKTAEPATFYFLNEQQKQLTENAQISAIIEELGPSFWQLSLTDLFNDKVNLADFKGKVVLLNFWGEWCKPCIDEIPELIEVKKNIPKENLEIISFAYSTRTELLKKVIADEKMDWIHVLLTENIREKFKINAYPTNILILADGKTCIRTNTVTYGFISSYVH